MHSADADVQILGIMFDDIMFKFGSPADALSSF